MVKLYKKLLIQLNYISVDLLGPFYFLFCMKTINLIPAVKSFVMETEKTEEM